MRIYTKAGELACKTFDFPDGQPHFKLETIDDSGFSCVNIETAIRTPHDLFQVMLASGVLRNSGFSEIRLDIRYLMGARMDRAISVREPFTLALVAQMINSCGFSRVRILDAHSEVATKLIRNSVNVLPFKVVEQVRNTLGYPVIPVCPDKGAQKRTLALGQGATLFCEKVREESTGKLSGFKIEDASCLRKEHPSIWEEANFLIIDDICDGGGTFTGLAKVLREAGAKKVFLYVTHGIFSKGLPLEGIDHVYTTNSLSINPKLSVSFSHLVPLTVIPISMKDL